MSLDPHGPLRKSANDNETLLHANRYVKNRYRQPVPTSDSLNDAAGTITATSAEAPVLCDLCRTLFSVELLRHLYFDGTFIHHSCSQAHICMIRGCQLCRHLEMSSKTTAFAVIEDQIYVSGDRENIIFDRNPGGYAISRLRMFTLPGRTLTSWLMPVNKS
jgi:hypothetical protein